MKRRSQAWSMDALMDFEYFLYRDETDPERAESCREKERNWYVEYSGSKGYSLSGRRFVFRAYLDFRRELEGTTHDHPLPGSLFRQVYGFLLYFLALSGLTSGAGICFSFLSYHGNEPLNVSSFFGIFILPQLAILLAAALMFLFLRFHRKEAPFSIIRFILGSTMTRLMRFIAEKTTIRPGRDTLSRLESSWGLLKGKSRCYGHVFPWPLFILTQVFAVLFNIGLISAMLLKILGSDLAFGWQSTVQMSSHAAYAIVRFISLPWSFAFSEPIAHPSLAQIEGSRMILKDGIASLTTSDLVSWWPFLFFCLLVYGLLPRLVLLFSAVTLERKALARIHFENMACDMLLIRLTHPLVETSGRTPTLSRDFQNDLETTGMDSRRPLEENVPGLAPLWALVPEDIAGDVDIDELDRLLRMRFGSGLASTLHVSLDISEDGDKIETFFENVKPGRIVMLMEAFQPPIRETLDFIRGVRTLAGSEARIHVLLIGKPERNRIFTIPSKNDSDVWTRVVNAMSDMNLRVHPIEDIALSEERESP
jgi:hypothetical protein